MTLYGWITSEEIHLFNFTFFSLIGCHVSELLVVLVFSYPSTNLALLLTILQTSQRSQFLMSHFCSLSPSRPVSEAITLSISHSLTTQITFVANNYNLSPPKITNTQIPSEHWTLSSNNHLADNAGNPKSPLSQEIAPKTLSFSPSFFMISSILFIYYIYLPSHQRHHSHHHQHFPDRHLLNRLQSCILFFSIL